MKRKMKRINKYYIYLIVIQWVINNSNLFEIFAILLSEIFNSYMNNLNYTKLKNKAKVHYKHSF